MTIKKDLAYYLCLPWSYTIEQDEENGEGFFIVRVNELPGVCTDGKTVEEAVQNIQEAIHAAIELYLEMGDEIPEPVDKKKYKGKIPYRTSSEIHYKLAMLAAQKHISINKTIDRMIKEGLRREGINR